MFIGNGKHILLYIFPKKKLHNYVVTQLAERLSWQHSGLTNEAGPHQPAVITFMSFSKIRIDLVMRLMCE